MYLNFFFKVRDFIPNELRYYFTNTSCGDRTETPSESFTLYPSEKGDSFVIFLNGLRRFTTESLARLNTDYCISLGPVCPDPQTVVRLTIYDLKGNTFMTEVLNYTCPGTGVGFHRRRIRPKIARVVPLVSFVRTPLDLPSEERKWYHSDLLEFVDNF